MTSLREGQRHVSEPAGAKCPGLLQAAVRQLPPYRFLSQYVRLNVLVEPSGVQLPERLGRLTAPDAMAGRLDDRLFQAGGADGAPAADRLGRQVLEALRGPVGCVVLVKDRRRFSLETNKAHQFTGKRFRAQLLLSPL
jgi:hypothetical protein